jgi:hypothetical protein
MTDEPVVQHMRPFFPSADDFAAATTPHFEFLVNELGYDQPVVEEPIPGSYDVRYDGNGTSVLLNWDAEGGFIGVHFVPRDRAGALNPDPESWLRPNEVLGARGARGEWVTQIDLEGVHADGYGRVMEREAANLRNYCMDVLRGDWSVYAEAHDWIAEHPDV